MKTKPDNFFNKMSMMRKVLQKDLDGNKAGLRTCNKDKVVVITGPEGMGKSNVAQVMFDIWYKEVLKDPDFSAEYIKFFGSNKDEFLEALNYCSEKNLKYQMIVHDEAAKDMYSRTAMSKFATEINKAYQVIRGMNLFTILIIPSILDLDSFFRKRRVNGLIHVFDVDYENKETQFAFFPKKRLGELLPELNRMAERQANPDPMKATTKPLFYDTAPLYNGVIKDAYDKRKQENMKSTIQDMYRKYTEKGEKEQEKENTEKDLVEGKRERLKKQLGGVQMPLYKRYADRYTKMYYEEGYSYRQIADMYGLSAKGAMDGVKWYIAEVLNDEERKQLASTPRPKRKKIDR